MELFINLWCAVRSEHCEPQVGESDLVHRFPMDVFLNALRARVLRRKILPHQLHHIKLDGAWLAAGRRIVEKRKQNKSRCEKKEPNTRDSDKYGEIVKWNILVQSWWWWWDREKEGRAFFKHSFLVYLRFIRGGRFLLVSVSLHRSQRHS